VPYSYRYYDEDAETIDCYVIFAELLNVSGAINDAVHWWNYTCIDNWSVGGTYPQYANWGQFFLYEPNWTPYPNEKALFEGSEGFFLKIISILKYYYPNLGNWTNVLTDVDEKNFIESSRRNQKDR
jgi:hypothetical protein